MQHARVFTAASLAQVIRQLLIYRPSGVLTIRRMGNGRQEEVSLVIEDGHPVRFRWGIFEDQFDETILRHINAWGAIQFIFQGLDTVRQLPAPNPPNHASQPAQPAQPRQPRSPQVTRPLPTLSTFTQHTHPTGENGNGYRKRNGLVPPEVNQEYSPRLPDAGSALSPLSQTHPTSSQAPAHARSPLTPVTPPPPLALSPETIIPVLTGAGHEFPVNKLPRYDRTIFLLINGQRSIADLMYLTRRPLSEVYSSLQRLREQQLIAGDL